MDYEKKYKDALELARVAAFNGHQSLMEGIFPELCESENEKIRKEIIAHCRNTRCVTEEGAERIAKWIAWLENLEKQGGQKPQRMISAEAKEAMYGKPAYAWNEEDEEMLRSIMATCELAEQERDSSPAKHLLQMQLNWLKSLKQRIGG